MKLLKQQPLGSAREEALKHINSKYGSTEASEWHMTIRRKYSGARHGFISRQIQTYTIVYPYIFAEIYAIWIFNEEGKLIDIKVHRYELAANG